MEIDIDVPAPFIELFKPSKKWRHIAYHGGRSSGKSTTVAIALTVKATTTPLRILCTREFQASLNDSVYKLLADIIAKYKLPNWTVGREYIRNSNGSEFLFAGVRNNIQSIKSMEGIDICWGEEAATFSAESLDVLIPTIRKDGSYFIWTFNRLTAEDPIWEKICKNHTIKSGVKK